jgi:endonuclease-3
MAASPKKRIPLLLAALEESYPETGTALDYRTPLQLAIATILSAQCTDKRVNLVTPALFARFPDARSFADAELSEIEEYIKSTGFFRNKAKAIKGFCEAVLREHGGEVPGTLDELVKLPGVGRKTANVVLGDAFGVPGITVDTHVGRLSRRLGLTAHTDPVKVELDLMKLIPQAEWTRFSHRLIFHGRKVCHARQPVCTECTLASLCPKYGVVTKKAGKPKTRKPTGADR